MKPGKMDKVAAVAKMTEHKSARELNLWQQSYKQKSDQLDQLVEFREGYELTLREKGSEGMSAKQLQDYRIFLSKLSQAIVQQASDVRESKESLTMVREKWLSATQRTSALDHLVDERYKERVKTREKAEQKNSDENTMTRGISNNEQ